MLEVEVLGEPPRDAPPSAAIERLCTAAVATAGVEAGHLAVEFVSAERIAELNALHRAKRGPTDVLSFPIDGADPLQPGAPSGLGVTSGLGGASEPDAVAGLSKTTTTTSPPRELGDVVICPEHTADLREAIVHGALHLVGMDHETDDGEMLALQAELLHAAP
ncbi:MAG TPA: rRNA maturation RNAse YbeY [Solirubrobacteraceae bacterium]|nr:rRNA maturation RNAse YbeY [Solirubrobacteraceae bacterium]